MKKKSGGGGGGGGKRDTGPPQAKGATGRGSGSGSGTTKQQDKKKAGELVNRGIKVWTNKGDARLAEQCYKEALAVYTDFPDAKYNLAVLRLEMLEESDTVDKQRESLASSMALLMDIIAKDTSRRRHWWCTSCAGKHAGRLHRRSVAY
jgi:hypothetical protein